MYYLDVALPFIYVWKDCSDDPDQVECSHILCAPPPWTETVCVSASIITLLTALPFSVHAC